MALTSSFLCMPGTARMAFGKLCCDLPGDVITFTAGGGEPIKMTRHEARYSPLTLAAPFP